MKNIKYLAIGALVAMSLTSCDKDTEGLTDITYYPLMTVLGGDVVMKVGDTYVDPGVHAEMNGEDISDQVVATNNINNQKHGFYKVTYSVKNPDGITATASRNVYVTNPGHFDNVYWGESMNPSGSRHFYNAPIIINDNGDGTYTINDLLGGYYCYGLYPGYDAYGYDFFVESIVHLDGDQVILDKEGDWYFYDPDDPTLILESTWDADAGTVYLGMNYWIVYLEAIN